jgi:PAS domain-containing protein
MNEQFLKLWNVPEHIRALNSDAALIKNAADQLQDPDSFTRLIEELYEHPERLSRDHLVFKDGRVYERNSKPLIVENVTTARAWFFKDITSDVQSETLNLARTNTLTHMAIGSSLTEILTSVIEGLEASYLNTRVEICFFERNGVERRLIRSNRAHAADFSTSPDWTEPISSTNSELGRIEIWKSFPGDFSIQQTETFSSVAKIAAIAIQRVFADAEIKNQKERFRAVFEGSSDAIMLGTRTGFFDCNEKTLRLFQLSSKVEFLDLHPGQMSPIIQESGRDSIEEANRQMEVAFYEGFSQFEWMHR